MTFYNCDRLFFSSDVMGLGGIPRKLFELRLVAAGQCNATTGVLVVASRSPLRLIAVEMLLLAIRHYWDGIKGDDKTLLGRLGCTGQML